MARIKKPAGREALEEFGVESRDGDSLPAASAGTQMQADASGTFPNENEQLEVEPQSTTPTTSSDDEYGQSLEEFKFLECDPLIPGDAVEPCPVCAPNEYAYVPDYRLMGHGEVFFNGKNCTQNVVLAIPSPARGGPTPTSIEAAETSFKERGIRLILDYFNKSDIATIYYYTKNPQLNIASDVVSVTSAAGVAGAGAALGFAAGGTVGAILGATAGFFAGGSAGEFLTPPEVTGYTLTSESRDVVAEILKYTEMETSVPIQRNARTRVLVSIPVEYLSRVPTKLEIEPTAEFETDLEVTINGSDFFPMFRRASRALRVYANKLDRWTELDGGALVERTTASADAYGSDPETLKIKVYLNLKTESALLELFRDNVRDMIAEGTNLTFKGFNQLEKITFKFEEVAEDNIQIKQVIVNKLGCPDIIFSTDSYEFGTKVLFDKYMKMSPFGESRTLYYVGALPEIDLALQARESMPWLEFITKFTYPGLEVYYGANGNSLMNDPSMAQCFAQAATQSTTGSDSTIASDILNAVANIGLSLPDAIIAEFSENTCKTREEMIEEYKKISSGEAGSDFADEMKKQLRRVEEIGKSSIRIDDPYLEMILEAISDETKAVKAVNAEYGTKKEVKGDSAKANARKEKIKEAKDLWRRVFNKLGTCGMISLVMESIDCVAQGLGEESATGALTEAAFNAMSEAHLERIFVGLSPEQQQAIGALVEDEFTGLPAPWDMGYVAGSYSGPGFRASDLIEASKEKRAMKKLEKDIEASVEEYREQNIQTLNEYFEASGVNPEFIPDFNEYTEEEINSQLTLMLEEQQAAGPSDAEIELIVEQPWLVEDETPPEYTSEEFTFYDGTLSNNSTGDDVRALQEALAVLGYNLEPYGADGIFGPVTEQALEQFQQDMIDQGIDMGSTGAANNGVDGVAGSITHGALNVAMNERLAEIQGLDYELSTEIAANDEQPEVFYDASAQPYTISSTGEVVPLDEEGQPIPEFAEEFIPLDDTANLLEAARSAEVPPPGPPPGTFFSGINFGEQSQGSGGTYGTALGNVQKALFDAYRKAILDAVGTDYLLQELNKLPGAPIVAGIIEQFKHMPCKPNPPWSFNPRLDSFLNTLEADFCNWDFDISLPELSTQNPGEAMLNLFRMIGLAIFEAIKAAALAIAMEVMKLIVEKALSIACDSIAMTGANLLDLFSGNDHFRDLLKDNMCPNATYDDLYGALNDILGAVTGPGESCLESLTNAEMGAFIDDISLMLTQGQVLQLLNGNPSQETLTLAMEVAATSNSECIREIFSDPTAFLSFFPGLGIFIPNLEELTDMLIPCADLPVHPCPPDIKDKIDNLKCELLHEKGLTTEECREQLDDLKDQALQDLKDLADILQNGPFSNFPPLSGGPGCPPTGFYPPTDPLIDSLNGAVSDALFKRLEETHLRDLMGPLNWFNGRGGVLNAIMSDTAGRPWHLHNWLVNVFGSPIAADMGFFEWNSDNAIKDPDSTWVNPAPIDIYGNKLKGQDAYGASFFKSATGGYPPTVGAWMAKSLRELDVEFKTVLTPVGYTNVSDALDDWVVVSKINQERIKKRREYIDAFFDRFEFEDGGPHAVKWPQKFSDAVSDMRKATSEKIFVTMPIPGHPDSEQVILPQNPGHQLYSGEDRLWKVLNARDISVAGYVTPGSWYGDWKKKIDHPAAEAGLSFVEWAGQDAALLELPDTSSADIKLHFADYGAGTISPGQRAADAATGAAVGVALASVFTLGLAAVPAAVAGAAIASSGESVEGPLFQFDLEYDYNRFDKDGILKKDNEYYVRITVTVTSPAGGGPAARQAQRRAGGGAPPASILDEGSYTYVLHEISSRSALDFDVQEYLDNLDVYNDEVIDSYEVEALYKFISNALILASSDTNEARLITERPEFREYFGSNRNVAAYDKISSGFLRRVAGSISSGRSDIMPAEEPATDAEPGFLEPPETEAEEGLLPKIDQIALDQISPAFKFGYDPYTEPNIEYLDPEEYGGGWARFLINMGFDKESVPQPFYVDEQKYGGWMDMVQNLVPEVDGCDPSRTPLFDLSDISRSSSQLASDLVQDKRLETDPLCTEEAPYDKILESHVAGNIDGALRAIIRVYVLDIFIRAVPAFVMFGLTDENYDDLLLGYVAEKLKQGLNEDGRLRSGRVDDTYYYRVLEQSVNSVVRKLDSGLLNPEVDLTELERQDLEIIISKVQEFYENYSGKLEALSSSAISGQNVMKRALSTPAVSRATGLGRGSAAFQKNQALAAKNLAFEQTIRDTEKQATTFLKRYIREEFAVIQKSFSDKVPAFVNNIHHLFLLSGNWISGGIYTNGPFDVQSDPTKQEDYSIAPGVPPALQNAIDQLLAIGSAEANDVAATLTASAAEINKDWPFVLEKYIRVEEKTAPPTEISGRKSNLYDVVNINDWDNYVKDKKAEGISGDISEFWGNPTLTGETTKIEDHTHNYEIDDLGNGITSTHIDASGNEHYHIIEGGVLERSVMNPSDNGHRHEIETTGWKFGLRLSYLVEKDKNNAFEDLMNTIAPETSMNSKAYNLNSPDGERYLVPIAVGELPIPDQEFTLFDPNSYDVYCLIEELVNTVEYRTWFKYMFPLPRYTSIMSIYIAQGFFASLGNSGWPVDGGDLWENAGGNRGMGPRFRRWARNDEEVYKRTRSEARDIFTTLYDTAASIDFQSENKYGYKDRASSVRDRIRPKVNFEDGLRWWQRGRRITNRPYDKDGKKCED